MFKINFSLFMYIVKFLNSLCCLKTEILKISFVLEHFKYLLIFTYFYLPLKQKCKLH